MAFWNNHFVSSFLPSLLSITYILKLCGIDIFISPATVSSVKKLQCICESLTHYTSNIYIYTHTHIYMRGGDWSFILRQKLTMNETFIKNSLLEIQHTYPVIFIFLFSKTFLQFFWYTVKCNVQVNLLSLEISLQN